MWYFWIREWYRGEGVIAEAHGENGRAISCYASGANGLAGSFVGDVNISGITTMNDDVGISGSAKLGTTEPTLPLVMQL